MNLIDARAREDKDIDLVEKVCREYPDSTPLANSFDRLIGPSPLRGAHQPDQLSVEPGLPISPATDRVDASNVVLGLGIDPDFSSVDQRPPDP